MGSSVRTALNIEKGMSLLRASLPSVELDDGDELRTPINAILSLSRLLLERVDGDLTSEQEKQVQFIRSSGESLLELVSDLLDLARIEAGKTVLRPRAFALDDLLGALRGMFRPLHVNDKVRLVFEAAPPGETLVTDEGKVAQILRNSIANALKFTEQGTVRVAVTSVSHERVEFAVSDTGIGIAPEHQERIFEEFAQVEEPIQQRVKGTGLGLSLSRKLAHLPGRSVRVQSEIGKGSAFFSKFPASVTFVKHGMRGMKFRKATRLRATLRSQSLILRLCMLPQHHQTQ